MPCARRESDIVIVEVFCDVFVDLQQFFVVCACALDDLIRNGLEVFDLLLGDRGDFFAHRIAEANALDIAEIGLFESGSLFLLVSVLVDAGVFLDDLIILQDRELAVCDAERAVLLEDRVALAPAGCFRNLQNIIPISERCTAKVESKLAITPHIARISVINKGAFRVPDFDYVDSVYWVHDRRFRFDMQGTAVCGDFYKIVFEVFAGNQSLHLGRRACALERGGRRCRDHGQNQSENQK